MNKVSRSAIKQLLETEDNVTLSLYLPTHRFPTSEHISEDKIRLKNLIKSGKAALKKQGVDGTTIRQITSQLEDDIYDNNDFWQHATEGMAVFCSPAGVRFFHLPIECGEYYSVGDRYSVAPLLALASYDHPYYLLALAEKNPVLFLGDMYGLERVNIDLPESIEKALNIDEFFSNRQTVRAGGYGAGNTGTKSHGQGDSKQAAQEERLKFFRLIDDKLLSSKKVDKKIPVLLAGTDDEVSGYRESSRIKYIVDTCLSGNYTESPLREVHHLSWPLIVSQLCDPERAGQIEKVRSLLGTGRASTEPEAIAVAALGGRVEMLLAGILTTTKDSITDSNQAVKKIAFSASYEKNKFDATSRSVFDQGGGVIGISKGDMPEGADMAAIYRY